MKRRISEPYPDVVGFVGRDRELSGVRDHFRRSTREPSWVIGPPGSGKTTLLLAFASQAGLPRENVIHISADALYDVTAIPALIAATVGGAIGQRVLRSRSEMPPDADLAIAKSLAAVDLATPLLLAIDDVDRLPEPQLRRVLRYIDLWSPRIRTFLVGRSLGLARKLTRKNAHVIDVGAPSEAELSAALRIRLNRAGVDTALAERFLGELRSIPIDATALPFNALFTMVEQFVLHGDAVASFEHVLRTLSGAAANLLIRADGERLRVDAADALEATRVITPSSRILTAAPFVVVPALTRLWRSKLDQFEEIINAKHVRESEIQTFFEENETLLCGIEYERAVAHPVLERDGDGDLIPDFFLKPINRDLVDVLDLKLPTDKLVVGRPNRKRLSAPVTEAMAQLREYRDYFENPEHRNRVRSRYGVHGYRPKTIVVIGRAATEVDEEKRQQIFDELPHHVKIVTYDDLLDRMRRSAWGRI